MKLKDLVSMKFAENKQMGGLSMSLERLKKSKAVAPLNYSTRCDLMDTIYTKDREKSAETIEKVSKRITEEYGDLEDNIDYAQNNYSLYCKTMEESEERKQRILSKGEENENKSPKISFEMQDPYVKLLIEKTKQK